MLITRIENVLRGTGVQTSLPQTIEATALPVGYMVVCTEAPVGFVQVNAPVSGSDYPGLFRMIWENLCDEDAPVSDGRGACAAGDIRDGKTIQIRRNRALPHYTNLFMKTH